VSGPSARGAGVLAAVVGVTGELLITLGVLLGLFVAWQLWWTDVVADRAQAQVVRDLDWAVTADETALSPEPADEPTDEPADEPAERQTGVGPVLAEPPHATTFATLRVPRWGADYVRPISEGTSRRDVLDVLGLGHYEGTAMPGGLGNFAVAGHRVTYGKPLNRIEELVVGDPVVVQTEDTWYVYTVTETLVVGPRQVDVVAAVPGSLDTFPTEALMTLTTCHPMYSARERYVVHAVLEYWVPVADGTPAEIGGDV
jgi:sortase A